MADSVFRMDIGDEFPAVWPPKEEQRMSHHASLRFPLVGISDKYRPEERDQLGDVTIRSLRGARSSYLFTDIGRSLIAPVLGEDVTWHEALVNGEPWHRMFVVRELDLLDAEHSWMLNMPSGNREPMDDSEAFKPAAIHETMFVLKGWESSAAYLGEELALRVQALGIRGLNVRKLWTLGQIFEDPSASRPPPTADPSWSERHYPVILSSVSTAARMGAEILGLNVPDDHPPQELVEAIDAHLERLHAKDTPISDADAVMLGTLYADQFRRAAGWEWTTVHHPENDEHGYTPAVVSPTRTHGVLSKFVIHNALDHADDAPITLIGSFVLAKSNRLQPQPPKAYVLLW